jgi:hypothetical protein
MDLVTKAKSEKLKNAELTLNPSIFDKKNHPLKS